VFDLAAIRRIAKLELIARHALGREKCVCRQNKRTGGFSLQWLYVRAWIGFNFLQNPMLFVEIDDIEGSQQAWDGRNASVGL
jgi:hypothetical protein